MLATGEKRDGSAHDAERCIVNARRGWCSCRAERGWRQLFGNATARRRKSRSVLFFSTLRAGREAHVLHLDRSFPRANMANGMIAPVRRASAAVNSRSPGISALPAHERGQKRSPQTAVCGTRQGAAHWSGYCVCHHCGWPRRVRQRTVQWMMAAASKLAGSRSGAGSSTGSRS